ncbi:ATP-binding protein [Methylocystis sp. 9N]|uniref:histidine kinase n=1 Tax=Methylocystis borbori TaxID=3118750 RepID=A0ABU7XGB5_9HYPH
MPLLHSKAGQRSLAALAAGASVLVFTVGAAIVLDESTKLHMERLLQLEDLRHAVLGSLSVLKDAETGQRGFLLTEQSEYLAPYESAMTREKGVFEELARICAILPEVCGDDLLRLQKVRNEKLAELRETVELSQNGDRTRALSILAMHRGKLLMDEARERVSKIVERAESLINGESSLLQEATRRVRWISMTGAVLIAGFAIMSLRILNSFVNDAIKAREFADALNASLEKRVAERTADLSRANEEIQRFAYVVTHDLRAPLVNIMGFTAELERNIEAVRPLAAHVAAADKEIFEDALFHEIPEALSFIRSSTNKMDGLIGAILKLSREGQRKLSSEPIDANALFERATAALAHQITVSDAEVTIAPALPSVISDRLALEQIFTNLLDNAIKYSKPGEPNRVTVSGFVDKGGLAVFEISDLGRGIASSDHDRIFEMFRRAGRGDVEGEGIGLAHVRATVRRLGGDITVDSELGQGARFRVKIPVNGVLSQGDK